MTHARRIAALNQFRQLEMAALAEATTLALLVLVAVPLKHFGEWDLGVRIIGPLHGFAFVAFLWNVWQTGTFVRWRGIELTRLVVSAFIPLGGFLNWRWLVRRTRSRARAIMSETPMADASGHSQRKLAADSTSPPL